MIELDIPTTATLSTTTASTILQTASDNQLLAAAEAGISSINSSGIAASALYGLCNQSAWQLALDSSNASTHCVGNHTSNADDISFILPWWRQVLWSILFGGMVIVATGGNLIVVWIVLAHKRMRTVTNYFIVNLSIADAMVSSLNVTFNYIYMLDNDWPFGELYCKISQFIATLSICASVFTLMAISIDRYVAIIKPLQPRMGKRSTLTVAATIWICSIILSCPMLLFFTTDQISSKDGIRTVCYSEWPDGSTNHSHQEYIYNILFMILTYFLPIISMIVTYSIVGLELWGSKAIGEYTPRQVENVKSKRRVVKMMIVVVVIFAVCWLPFQIYFIVTSCYPDITEMPFIQEVFLAIYWLAMSNSMYNPIIYCWMNSRFRRGFKQFFRWCPFVHIGAETLNRRDNMTSRYSCSGSPDHHRIIRNDTERSFLYTCPGSPKSRRISHCGAVRNSALACQRDPARHSTPVGGSCGSAHLGNNLANSYHQRHSGHVNAKANANANTNANTNGHELSALCPLNSSKDYMKVATRNNTLQLRQKWTPPAAAADPQDNGTAAATATATTTTTTTTAATTASGAAATTGASGNASTVVTGLMPHRVTALS